MPYDRNDPERMREILAMPRDMPPVHPGEVLLEDFLKPLGMSQNALARAVGVPPRRINEIVLGKRSVTGDTALRLARFFGNTPEFWTGLQAGYELALAETEIGDALAAIVPMAESRHASELAESE
jgi:addiction module HigA family antidote